MLTVIGIAADALGHATRHTYGLDERGAAWRDTEHSATPSSVYRVATDHLAVDWCHDKIIGSVAHLERQAGNLWAVAEVNTELLGGITDELGAGRVYWSPHSWDTRSRHYGHHGLDAELMSLALTPEPGSNALPPVKLLAGDLDYAANHAQRPLAARLTRAVEARRCRRHGDRIRIVDLDPPAPVVHDRQAGAPIHRSASGRRKLIDGQWVEIEYSAPYHGGVLSVR